MSTVRAGGRTFDARPDRIDLRDRIYTPRLASLPARYPDAKRIGADLAAYEGDGMILDQRQEGACTGFGLAAVVNYLLWVERRRASEPAPRKVSPRMLYHLARFHDEWPGEDYSGSSCRGAMKGWHHHGICEETLWPYLNPAGVAAFVKPDPTWEANAATRPLGAYYRIDKASVEDMQSAIVEVGAIYASATVHDGWFLRGKPTMSDEGIRMIVVPSHATPIGGHAFALVGYTAEGFIVQNSWGSQWGTRGFAILTYDDWVERGSDAWVAVMGAPMRSSRVRERTPIDGQGGTPPTAFWSVSEQDGDYTYQWTPYKPWDEGTAYRHSIVMGNNGIVLNRIAEARDALASHELIAYEAPRAWFDRPGPAKLVIYAHGGLNDEAASIRRVRVLAPYFKENGVYPVFLTWKTGIWETLKDIVQDHVDRLGPATAWRDVWGGIKRAAQEAKDRLVEAACQELRVKAIWDQMKQNARAAATAERPTLGLTARALLRLRSELRATGRELEIHLVGHSAGAILLGHLLDLMANPGSVARLTEDPTLTGERPLAATTCSLFAPACTLEFALEHYGGAIMAGVLQPATSAIDILVEDRERADSVGPYGKSLLYLVSRGLEDYHKTPLLGLAKVWDRAPNEWDKTAFDGQVAGWNALWAQKGGRPAVQRGASPDAADGRGPIPWLHGTFDNDVAVITETITRIAGRPPVSPVENLRGY